MRRRGIVFGLLGLFAARNVRAGTSPASGDVLKFQSIDGGPLDLAAFRGGPVLVVNTASRCGFTSQYDGLQTLYDTYKDRGLTVVGVPSDSFRQELATDAEVKTFCEVNFDIDFPMTGMVPVRGRDAHPFYRWAAEQGVVPSWNFHKILLDGQSAIVAEFGPLSSPSSRDLIQAIENQLPRS